MLDELREGSEEGAKTAPRAAAGRISAQDFWNDQARWNARVAILDGAEIRDAQQGERAFDRAGEENARAFLPFVHPGSVVVDLGCGIGRVMRPLAPLVREVVGVDVSDEMLERAAGYLSGLPNTRLVHTDGRSLPEIADGSVDFLHSTLCFIHVDRRSAFRYFGEIARVLAEDGRALLQFHDVLTPEGMEKLVRIVDSEYPLEFYTEAELRALLARNGLDVLSVGRANEYLFLQVARGPAGAWLERWRRGFAGEPVRTSGAFAGDGARGPSELEVALDLRDALTRGFHVELGMARADGGVSAAATLHLTGPGRRRLLLRVDERSCSAELDGAPIALRPVHVPPAERGRVFAALLPSGLPPGESLARFPELALARALGRD